MKYHTQERIKQTGKNNRVKAKHHEYILIKQITNEPNQ
jgi:hypothetical protein